MNKARLLKISALVGVSCIALGAISAVNSIKRFDLMFNPIVSKIRDDKERYGWGDRVTLIPAQIQKDETRKTVLQKLRKTGFADDPKFLFWDKFQDQVDLGREVFTREANRFPCNIRIYVILEFGSDDGLILAQGAQYEHGCL